MENVSEQRGESLWERAQRSIGTTFEQIALLDYLPVQTGQPTVAILGAGVAVEVQSLHDYFTTHQRLAPRIIAFDVDKGVRILTEEIARLSGVEVDYRTADASDRSTFDGKQYDIIIIRKPDVHKGQENWRRIIQNALRHLKPNGCILVTTSEHEAYKFVSGELKDDVDVVLEYNISEERRVHPFFNEDRFAVSEKKELSY